MTTFPEPHPLDFDWRFTQQTSDELCELLPIDGRVLTVGTPSVARRLQAQKRAVTLVDRQPFQDVTDHRVLHLDDETPVLIGFKSVILDPPWYPHDLRLWTAWAAHALEPGQEMIASFWPRNVRPSEAEETQDFRSWISTWASVDEISIRPEYEVPQFEQIAIAAADNKALSASPRVGRLLRIKVITAPPSGLSRCPMFI